MFAGLTGIALSAFIEEFRVISVYHAFNYILGTVM